MEVCRGEDLGCWVQWVPGSIIVQLLDLEIARDPLPPFLECIRKNPAKDFVEQTIPITVDSTSTGTSILLPCILFVATCCFAHV